MSETMIVAKFGGSSMANPSLVARRLEEAEASPSVVVVSAAGKDAYSVVKMTDMLIEYDEDKSPERQARLLQRLAQVAGRTCLSGESVDQLVARARGDLAHFAEHHFPAAALGERWSAKLLSEMTGREYLEAADVIRFTNEGIIDVDVTSQLLRQRVIPGGQYVMPGFYGATESGEVRTLERGGSDVSGALCALALRATEYQNWSDVDGFYTANPREVPGAVPITELTYREARELANGGSELLHREVGRHLVGTGIPTRMMSTMSGQSNTIVTDSRDTSRVPLAGVSGARNMIELSHDEFGSEEKVGTSVDLYKTLRRHDIPYVHSATSTDTVSIYIDQAYADAVRAAFTEDSIEQVSALHVVGQRLLETPLDRTRTLGELAAMLMREGIALKGFTDAGRSPATTLFVATTEYDRALHSINEHIVASRQ